MRKRNFWPRPGTRVPYREVSANRIAFVVFHKPHEGVDRGESRSQADVAGLALFHSDGQVLFSHQVCRSGRVSTFSKIAQAFQALPAQPHAHRVENLAGRNRQLTPYDPVLGLSVPANLDFFDVGFLALFDFELESMVPASVLESC